MADGDNILEICAGVSLFLTAVVVTLACVKNACAKKEAPTMKQSPSMEELTTIGIEDPAGI